MAKSKANPDGYVHTRDGKEYQRLRDQARMWQAATAHVLAAVGLGPGMSCLDVGSGPGAVMRLMADRVGPEGRVTGIEIDGALGAEALQGLRRDGGAEFEQITADLLKLEGPTGAPFDLTFCRLLLMHMRDPVAILEKMSAWTKPGGVVVAQEFDFGAIAVERADLPGHGRVQSRVRGGVQGSWTQHARRASAAGAIRGGRARNP
jgi:ubiquinone/menaquinone biosynthesis C-methylase UbiE